MSYGIQTLLNCARDPTECTTSCKSKNMNKIIIFFIKKGDPSQATVRQDYKFSTLPSACTTTIRFNGLQMCITHLISQLLAPVK